jgi:hypothetical protein
MSAPTTRGSTEEAASLRSLAKEASTEAADNEPLLQSLVSGISYQCTVASAAEWK